MDKWDILDKMLEYMRADELLSNLVNALSTYDAIDNFKYIARCYDINIFDEDEDEDED